MSDVVCCPTCAAERPVLTPPCADGHGEQCPDRLCSACATAFVLDPVVVLPLRPRRARTAARAA